MHGMRAQCACVERRGHRRRPAGRLQLHVAPSLLAGEAGGSHLHRVRFPPPRRPAARRHAHPRCPAYVQAADPVVIPSGDDDYDDDGDAGGSEGDLMYLGHFHTQIVGIRYYTVGGETR